MLNHSETIEQELMRILGLGNFSEKNIKRCLEIINLEGLNANYQNNSGITPLHFARNLTIAKALINAGADADLRDHQERTPVEYLSLIAETPEELSVITFLKQHQTQKAEQKLMMILGLGDFSEENIKTCLEIINLKGFDPNYQINSGITPLHFARNLTIATALINAGADADLRDHQGRTPVDYLSIFSKTPEELSVITFLKEHQAQRYYDHFAAPINDDRWSYLKQNPEIIQRYFNYFAASVNDEQWDEFIVKISQSGENFTQFLGLENLIPLIAEVKKTFSPNDDFLTRLLQHKNILVRNTTESKSAAKDRLSKYNKAIDLLAAKPRSEIFMSKNITLTPNSSLQNPSALSHKSNEMAMGGV